MTLKDTIYKILLEQPETRDSDKKLIWEVWKQTKYVIDYDGWHICENSFMFAPSPESIRRCRQALQRTDLLTGAKLIQPTKSVKEKRVKLSKSKGFEYQEAKFDEFKYYFDPITNSYKER